MSNDTSELTITEFFELEERLTQDELEEEELGEGESRFQRMKTSVENTLKGYVVPDAFYDMLFKHVMELLNIEIPGLLTETWRKYDALAKYLNEEKYPPSDTFYSPLLAHTFTSVHNPSLQPTINQVSLGNIKVAVKFSLKLDGVLLQIKEGKIEGFRIGQCVGSGELAIQGVQMIKKVSEPWSFPNMIMLPNPLQIPDVRAKTIVHEAGTRVREIEMGHDSSVPAVSSASSADKAVA